MNTQNQRKRELKTGVKTKYNAYLNEIYKKIRNDEYINMNLITNTFNISKQVTQILQEEKIIKKISRGKYIWIGKIPSLEMVDIIIERARINSFERLYPSKEIGQKKIDFKTPVTKPVAKPVVSYSITKPVVKVEKKTVSISLFWGMFKYKKD